MLPANWALIVAWFVSVNPTTDLQHNKAELRQYSNKETCEHVAKLLHSKEQMVIAYCVEKPKSDGCKICFDGVKYNTQCVQKFCSVTR